MCDTLSLIFNKMYNNRDRGTITPVYKFRDSRNTVENYRGITIQSVISKLYSIILND